MAHDSPSACWPRPALAGRVAVLLALALAAALAAAITACTPDVDFEVTRKRMPQPIAGASGGAAGAGELALLTWNIEWFQDPERGPADDARQFEFARDVLVHEDVDLAGLQEIASPARLAELVTALPEHAVVASRYDWPQQTALVYRAAELELVRVTTVFGLDDAGRPPLEVELLTRDGTAVLVLVVHAKAGRDAASHARRERFAHGLRQHLDARRANTQVIVLGDFNDRFTGSITDGAPSPYAELARGSGYTAPTAALESGAEASSVWGEIVDHVLLSDDLAANVVPGSVEVLRDEWLAQEPDFFEAVSDHAPVTLRLRAPR